jgi:hypothetical protein
VFCSSRQFLSEHFALHVTLEISEGLHANYLLSVSDFNLTLLVKLSYIKFYGNLLSGSGNVTCGRQI